MACGEAQESRATWDVMLTEPSGRGRQGAPSTKPLTLPPSPSRAPIIESMGVVDGDCVAAGEYPGKAAPQEITWEADLTTCQRFRCRLPAVQPCTCLARRYPTQESFGGGVCEVWTQRLGSGGGLDLNDAWSEVIIEFDHRARHVIEKLVRNHQTCDAPVPSGDVLDVVGHAHLAPLDGGGQVIGSRPHIHPDEGDHVVDECGELGEQGP